MRTPEMDPAFIAKQVKFIRKLLGFTQENLAGQTGLTTRTIRKGREWSTSPRRANVA